MIQSSEISFVVQGPVVDVTQHCLDSIRNFYPNSVIILSTWKGTNLDHIKGYDSLVLSDDPGDSGRMFDLDELSHIKNNINRQLVSTQAGLRNVTTKYVVKTRTDFEFKNQNLLSYLNKFRDYPIDSTMRFVTERIVALGADREVPFFVFDFAFAGLAEDIHRLFDIPLMPMKIAQYFPEHQAYNPARYSLQPSCFRWIPEQYILLSALKLARIPSGLDLNFGDWTQIEPKTYEKSISSLGANFTVLDFEKFGVYPTKDSLKWLLKMDKKKHIFFDDWLTSYKHLSCKLK